MSTLVEFGKLAKPVTVLIEKISNATGILYEPTKIRKKALADADASKTKALMDLEIADIQKRALSRLVTEEIKKQENIENITEKSFSSLDENAKPENIEDDWMSNFFDKCKLISDDEMQILWSKVLAGEANKAGSFSKRTIEFMSTMDKNDAILFNKLSTYCWYMGEYQPLIIDYENEIFKKNNINFGTLSHLSELGLINFNHITGFNLTYDIKHVNIGYFGRVVNLHFNNQNNNTIETGSVKLTKIGQELIHATLLSEEKSYKLMTEYFHYCINNLWKTQKISMAEPIGNKIYNKT